MEMVQGWWKIVGLVLGSWNYAIPCCHRLNHSTNTGQIIPKPKAQRTKKWIDCPQAPSSKPEVELLQQINNTNLDHIIATKLPWIVQMVIQHNSISLDWKWKQ